MSIDNNTLGPPDVAPTRSRGSVFHVEGFPSTATDFEHRPAWTDEPMQFARLFGWMLLLSTFAVPLSLALRWWVGRMFLSVDALLVSLLAGSILCLVQLNRQRDSSVTFGVQLFFLPPAVCTVLALTANVHSVAGQWAFFVLAAIPIAALAGNSIANHTAFWATADSSHTLSKKLQLRAEWASRWSFRPAPDMRQLWHREQFLLIAAVALVTAVGCSHFHPPMNRTRTLLTAMAATWIVTFLRVGCSLYSIGQATRFLVHWFAYSADPGTPPYVFQSPEGPRWRRLAFFVASYATWAFAILTLTEYGECRLSLATESGQWPTLTVFIKEVVLVNVWPFLLVSLSWITVILSVVAPVVHYFRLQSEDNR